MIELIKELLCVAGGVGIGYFVARNRLEQQHHEALQKQKEDVEYFFRLKYENKLKEYNEAAKAKWYEGVKDGLPSWLTEEPELLQSAAEAAAAMGEYMGVEIDPASLAENVAETMAKSDALMKFVLAHSNTFKEQDGTTLSQAWDLFKSYTEESGSKLDLDMTSFRESLKDYFEEFNDRAMFGGNMSRNVYAGFKNEDDVPVAEPPAQAKPVFDAEPVGTAARFERPSVGALGVVNYAAISSMQKTADEPAEEPIEEVPPPAEKPSVVRTHPAAEITKEQFVKNEEGLEQYSFTYFVGDDVLANESDEPLEPSMRRQIVSQEIIQKLKVGPEAMDGATTLYIRNPKFNEGEGVEVEIERSPGKYSDEVENN